MPTIRTVTGNIAALTGVARAGVKLTFRRLDTPDVFGQYGQAILNEPITVNSNEGGMISVPLYPGEYHVVAQVPDGPKYGRMALTESGSTDFSELLDQASAPITTNEVADARAARDKAEQWADEDEDVEVEPGQFSARHWAGKARENALATVPISIPSLFNGGVAGDLFRTDAGYLFQDRAGTVPVTAPGQPVRAIRGQVNGYLAAVLTDDRYWDYEVLNGVGVIRARAASRGFALGHDVLPVEALVGSETDDHGFFLAAAAPEAASFLYFFNNGSSIEFFFWDEEPNWEAMFWYFGEDGEDYLASKLSPEVDLEYPVTNLKVFAARRNKRHSFGVEGVGVGGEPGFYTYSDVDEEYTEYNGFSTTPFDVPNDYFDIYSTQRIFGNISTSGWADQPGNAYRAVLLVGAEVDPALYNRIMRAL